MAGSTTAAIAEDQYNRVIDIVEDGGADNTGQESITPVLREQCGDNTLLKFPPGEYYMDEQFRFTGFTNFGMVGDNATIVPADYHNFDGPQYRLFRMGVYYSPGKDFRFENFTIDQTGKDTGIRTVEAQISDGLAVRNIDVVGQHDSGTYGPGLFDITSANGSGVVEQFNAPDGGEYSENTPGDLWRGPTGILSTKYHEGTVEFKDCTLGAFPDNGLYAVTNGTIQVQGGTYKNSEAASVRLGGDSCKVQDTTVVVDNNRPNDTNQRGVRLDKGDFTLKNVTVDLKKPNGHAISVMNGVSSADIRSTNITIGDKINHGIVVSPEAGATNIVYTDIEINGGGNAIQINGTDAGAVVCQHMDITGTASGSSWRHAIKCRRNDCEFRDVNIYNPGENYRRGIEISGDDCLVYKGWYRTSHHPIVVTDSSNAWIEGITGTSLDDYQAIRLNDTSSNVTIKNNDIHNGVLDKGCGGLRMYGNDTS